MDLFQVSMSLVCALRRRFGFGDMADARNALDWCCTVFIGRCPSHMALPPKNNPDVPAPYKAKRIVIVALIFAVVSTQ